MARQGAWAIWFGKGLSPAVLIPLAIFFTYKANNDSAVFNMDVYRNLMMRMLGLRLKRHVAGKEVIIQDPDLPADVNKLENITQRVVDYNKEHNLKSLPNVINVFFRYRPDHEVEAISNDLEAVIDDLSNTRDRYVLSYLNAYPVLAVKAHTRPFERRWLNILAAVIVPAGIFFYLRMWIFRLRLYHDLTVIKSTNEALIKHIKESAKKKADRQKIG